MQQPSDKLEDTKLTYPKLITEALQSVPNGMLSLSEIYAAISARHPSYKLDSRGWQNSVRHTLTLNKSFTKIPRLISEGRGSYWKLDPTASSPLRSTGRKHRVKPYNLVPEQSGVSKAPYEAKPLPLLIDMAPTTATVETDPSDHNYVAGYKSHAELVKDNRSLENRVIQLTKENVELHARILNLEFLQQKCVCQHLEQTQEEATEHEGSRNEGEGTSFEETDNLNSHTNAAHTL